MAKATRIEIPPKPVEPEIKIILELSLEEANTLKGVVNRIGGPQLGRRAHTTAIGHALYDAGVRGDIEESEVEPLNRAIYFTRW